MEVIQNWTSVRITKATRKELKLLAIKLDMDIEELVALLVAREKESINECRD